MVKYQNGVIYKIVNDVNAYVYIGSTCQFLCNKMAFHRFQALKNVHKNPLHSAMRDIGTSHFHIIFIKECPCTNKDVLKFKEFAIRKEYLAQGIPLYNVPREYCGISRNRIRTNNTGENGYAKRGGIYYHQKANSWIYMWSSNGKSRMMNFSVKKWGGEWEAKTLAACLQNQLYPPSEE